MKENRFRRYQVRKKIQIQINRDHPWIFHGSLSSAAEIFEDGDWIRLVDGNNKTIGYGIFSEDKPISIRVFHFGDSLRNRYFLKKLRDMWKKRMDLTLETNAIRLVHGESDGVPGITVDLYDQTAIIQYYSPSTYTLGRLIAFLLPHCLPEPFAKHIQIRAATRMGLASQKARSPRWVRGQPQREVIIKEGSFQYEVNFQHGHKGGFYLDLRGIRRFLSEWNFEGKDVLNLFSYTGSLSAIAIKQGARKVISVDQSRHAAEQHQKNLQLNEIDLKRDQFIRSDAFRFLGDLDPEEKFDLIIIDPPSLAARQNQVPMALKKIEQIHRLALSRLKPEGFWISLCCTARIDREQLVQTIGKVSKEIVGKGQTQIIAELPEEKDHPVIKSFPEGRYLTQLVFSNHKE